MAAKLKPYPVMKDSGISWLGVIPEHWEVKPNRAMFKESEISNHPYEQLLSVTISNGVIKQTDLLLGTAKKDASNLDKSKYKLVLPGEIAYNKMRAWQGAIGLSRYRGIISPAYVVERPSAGISPEYMNYLLRTSAFAKEAERWSYGITSDMWSLRPEHFKMIYGCLPPIQEQSTIVRFLDHMDRRIRRYIRARQLLISLLEEQKQAIIHRAVTRGLDPGIPLKPSGVEWLGDVPEHWEVRKLGHVSKVFNGSTPSRMHPEYWHRGTIPWVSSGKVNDHIVETPSELITELAIHNGSISIAPKGSVILGLVGQGKTRGMSALMAIDAYINQNLAAIVPRFCLDGRFLHYFLTAHYSIIREIGRGGNQEAMNCDLVSRLRIPVAPLEEQVSLVDHLDRSTSNLVHVSKNVEQEISLLREYRARLITDVVTGKLDVRGVDLPAADDSEAPEEYGDIPDCEAVIEDDEMKELRAEGD